MWPAFSAARRGIGSSPQASAKPARGSWYPTLLTLCITAILLGWAAYALSAAGALPELPLLKAGIVAITGVYSLRGLVLLPVLAFWPTQVTPFLVWSSLICLGYGVVHLFGLVQVWPKL